jgi:FkbH-like protein
MAETDERSARPNRLNSAVACPIARQLRQQRQELALALAKSVASWEKYSGGISPQNSLREFAERETVVFVDYLVSYFEVGDPTFRDLYIGEKLKQCYSAADSPEEAIARRKQITAADLTALIDTAGSRLQPAERGVFIAELERLHATITKPGDKLCRVLLVGDCLFLDILAFLTAPLTEAGIQLVPSFVTSKLLSQQHRDLRCLDGKQFDLIFYSPLTYAFNVEFSKIQSLKGALRRPALLKAVAAQAKREIESTLQLMEQLFECPIFVHNFANLRRRFTASEIVKIFLTQWQRQYTRHIINQWLPEFLERLNAQSHRHLFLIDETALFAAASERELSSLLYNGGQPPPARFAQALTPVYQDIIVAWLSLSKKKVIVCDLDNTLWRGVIGEGPVEHFTDRQAILLTLRRKGVLLAICSKNDPKNVDWDGGTLCEADFVTSKINWESKVANLRSIAKHLNLKTKDFIFIDDRADERELIRQLVPDVTVLDAESPLTWRHLAIVARTMPESEEVDRTIAYKQKEERERFLTESTPGSKSDGGVGLDASSVYAEAEALAKLELQLSLRIADRRELKRVSELINRTNQFNTCGKRATLQEVMRWHQSEHHTILIGEAKDKFGKMGTILAAVVEETSRGVEIPTFVLSCRVFGFSMEDALLSRIKLWRPGRTIYGHFKETSHNQACRRVYPDNDFTWDGRYWVFRGGKIKPDPAWLKVVCPQMCNTPFPTIAALSRAVRPQYERAAPKHGR